MPARADAQRDQRGFLVRALELVEHGAEDHAAGGAQRVAHGDGAAVHVHLLVRNIQRLHHAQHDRRERFVELVEIDVLHASCRASSAASA
jgi:hypothetical protein